MNLMKKLYPVLGTGGIITYIDNFYVIGNDVLIGRKGTINKPQYMKTPFWSVDTLFYSKPKLKQILNFNIIYFKILIGKFMMNLQEYLVYPLQQ